MAKTQSFDITTGCDPQEVDNALNQARREITNRYDFKGLLADISYDRQAGTISIHTTDQFKLDAIWQVLVGRFVARDVPVENVRPEAVEEASGSTVRQVLTLVQSIDQDTARRLNRFIRDQRIKRVSSQVQNDAVRVTGPGRDELQALIRLLRAEEWGMQLQYGNYR